MELLNLILNAGQGEGKVRAFDLEGFLHPGFGADGIQMLSRRERKLQQLSCTVDQLTGGNIRGAADFGAPDVLPFRLHQQQLRGAAGQMPGKVRLLHQFQMARTPQRCGHMALLVGNLHQRDVQRIGKELGMGVTHHKTGHIAALHRPGTGTDAHSGDCTNVHIRKQPAG